MPLVRSRITWLLAAIASAVVVAIAGWTGDNDDLPPRPLFAGASDVAELVDRTLPRGFAGLAATASGTPLLPALVNEPVVTWRSVEATCEVLTAPGAGVAAIVERTTSLWTGFAPPAAAPPADLPKATLPLRAPRRLGDLGSTLLRASTQNSARFPDEFTRALSRLSAAVDDAARKVRAWRARTGAPDRIERAVAEIVRRALSEPVRGTPLDADVAACVRGTDRAELAAIASALAREVDVAVPALRSAARSSRVRELAPLPSGGGVPGGLVLVTETDAGLVVVGGTGRSQLPVADVALALDLGGDDRWHDGAALGGPPPTLSPLAPPVRVAIDLSGDDEYTSTAGRLGTAAAGVAVLVDLDGADRYGSETFAFGAAALGVAAFEDVAGEDEYRAAGGVGCGAFGCGALVDLGGDDHFELGESGAGAAIGGGLGFLGDAWGNDVHLTLAPGEDGGPTTYGASAPAEPGGAGGAAIFVDRRGDDVYRPNHRSCGCAASGFALFVDGAGDDLYSCGEDALGAAKAGLAVFRDLGGADDYLARARSLGFAARGLGLFLDEGGVDHSLSLAPSRGAGEDGGVGVHADLRDGEALPRR